MKITALLCIIFTVLSLELGEAAAKTRSEEFLQALVESIPMPHDRAADPNTILDKTATQELRDIIHQTTSSLTIDREGQVTVTSGRSGGSEKNAAEIEKIEDIGDTQFPVQIVVTVVEKLDVTLASTLTETDIDVEELTRQFTTKLHNSWGIGREITSHDGEDSSEKLHLGGTGVLVFLSVRDRVLYISVGGALDHILTSGRLNRVITDAMGPDLKKANYGLGLIKGIGAIVQLLVDNEEPSSSENNKPDSWNQIFLVLVVGFGFLYGRNKRLQEQRQYAKVASQLSELDRARAELLQVSYQETTSCPICLEDFASKKCGSDGHPIQLLRCGHVFDKTCYEQWISSGNGDITKCPVCRADVRIGHENPPIHQEVNHSLSEGYHGSSDETGDLRLEDLSTFESEGGRSNNENTILNEIRHDEPRMSINIQFREDRIFRLERLSELYPRYITSDTVTRWSSPSFHGSLADDPSFRSRNPSSSQTTLSSASGVEETIGRGCAIFDGGTSSGGAGATF